MTEFYWGAATSAFQVEGHVSNDFTEWESLGYFRKNGFNPQYNNGCNHWVRWQEDFDLLKELNLNSYRFSIEWARIENIKNTYSETALTQYSEMIDYLISLNIEPFLTLHHFSHPQWFHSATPWHNVEAVDAFCNYAKTIIDRFGDRIKYWITFNEPLVWALAAYGAGKFPPGYKNLKLMMDAVKNMLAAHVCLYDYIKNNYQQAKIGMAKHFIIFKEGREWILLDKTLTKRIHEFFNQMILNAFSQNRLIFYLPTLLKYDSPINLNNKIDFWGINYYYKLYAQLKFNLKNPIYLFPKEPETDMGWEIYPKGLKKIIKLVASTGKEIIITENGIATNDDELRKHFIKKHLKIVKKARKKYKVRGYFYWSLLDNYEWLIGKSKRFGLIKIDYENSFNRIIKPSAFYYTKLINKYSKVKSEKKI